jgi:mannose-6-phosphate isomerase
LGKSGAERFGGRPFLFKLLAAAKPLSIQAHPNLEQAREGFERENRAGIPLEAPRRNYKDPNHKPEIICALSPFTGMCGFRGPGEIREGLEQFLAPAPRSLRRGFSPLLEALENPDGAAALREFLSALFGLSSGLRGELTAYILGCPADADSGEGPAEDKLRPSRMENTRRFAELYPEDPAIIAPFYLNLFSLEPGEAVFLRAGVPHAYLHGFGVELMANSDNVLRGGLTSKHVDVPELLRILDFSPGKPDIIGPPGGNRGGGAGFTFRYPSPCEEFSLAVYRGDGGERAFTGGGPAVCVVTGGELEIVLPGVRAPRGADSAPPSARPLILKQGEAVFIPAGENGETPLLFRGNYTAYSASIPGGAASADKSEVCAGRGPA